MLYILLNKWKCAFRTRFAVVLVSRQSGIESSIPLLSQAERSTLTHLDITIAAR
jgi:hypothetical protein